MMTFQLGSLPLPMIAATRSRDEKSVDDNEIHGEFPEIPDFLRKTPKEEKFVEEIPEAQLRKIVDQLSRILGDELEEYQLIYKSGKASQRLKKILSAYIRTRVLYGWRHCHL